MHGFSSLIFRVSNPLVQKLALFDFVLMTISEFIELSSGLLLSEVIRYHFEKSTKLKIFSRVAISETNELSSGLKLSVVILKKQEGHDGPGSLT